ncbi:MAG: DNA alkylation repair protein [Candidatus Aminicenantes bacterium]|nr:MAG: DNA alkylation repair protein [Candidatus Aminicenantes bacterium]
MTYREAMRKLKALGTAQNRKVYKRHGAGKNLFGVSFANLGKLQKEIKIDHDLAEKLWASGNTDAQSLATMIIDPKQASEDFLDRMVKEISYYTLVDIFVRNIVSKSPLARKKMQRWVKSKNEWIGRAGWMLLSILAMQDKDLQDQQLETYLKTIEKNIHQAKNRTREAMNSALISIGIRNDRLERLAIATAKRIGPVEVDHGETACKTPEAEAYIKKARSRAKKKK